MDPGRLQRRGSIEAGEQAGQPVGQHRLPRARRADQQEVVAARRGHLQCPTRQALPPDVGQIGGVAGPGGRRGGTGRSVAGGAAPGPTGGACPPPRPGGGGPTAGGPGRRGWPTRGCRTPPPAMPRGRSPRAPPVGVGGGPRPAPPSPALPATSRRAPVPPRRPCPPPTGKGARLRQPAPRRRLAGRGRRPPCASPTVRGCPSPESVGE